MHRRWIPLTLFLAAALPTLPAAAADPPPAAAPDPRATLEQARARQALADYDAAADGLERFVRLTPQASEAPQALQDAVVLRLGLGQADQAEKDADLFVRNYAAKQPAMAARVALAVAASSVDHEDWPAAERQIGAWMTAFERGAPLEARLRAHASLGRAFVNLNKAQKAEAEYAQVRALWAEPQAAVATIQQEGGNDRQIGASLNAVGEALFFSAEQTRKSADAIRFPEYKGRGSKDAIAAHLRTKVVDWVRKKRAVIEDAEKSYLKVVEIQPVPPPRWIVASASRVGQLWARFVAEFRAAPVPREWKGKGKVAGSEMTYPELRKLYYQALDQASEPHKQHALAAFKTCVKYSATYQYADEYSRRCAEWLAKNEGRAYLPIVEFLPHSGLLGTATPAEPLLDPR